jgi:hypothetical protein
MQPRSQTHSEEGRVYGCVDEAHTSICAGGPQPRSTSMADQHDRLLCFPRRSPLTGGPHTRRPPLSHTHGGPLPTCAAAHTLPQRLSRPFLFWRGCARFRNIRLLYSPRYGRLPHCLSLSKLYKRRFTDAMHQTTQSDICLTLYSQNAESKPNFPAMRDAQSIPPFTSHTLCSTVLPSRRETGAPTPPPGTRHTSAVMEASVCPRAALPAVVHSRPRFVM